MTVIITAPSKICNAIAPSAHQTRYSVPIILPNDRTISAPSIKDIINLPKNDKLTYFQLYLKLSENQSDRMRSIFSLS